MKAREMQRTHQSVHMILGQGGKDSGSEDGMTFAGARTTKPSRKHFYIASDGPIEQVG